MSIRRYLVMVVVLVGMSFATVWYRNRVLAAGYEAVRLERDIARSREEEQVERSVLASLTSPAAVVDKNIELELGLERRPVVSVLVARGGRGGRSTVTEVASGRRVEMGHERP